MDNKIDLDVQIMFPIKLGGIRDLISYDTETDIPLDHYIMEQFNISLIFVFTVYHDQFYMTYKYIFSNSRINAWFNNRAMFANID